MSDKLKVFQVPGGVTLVEARDLTRAEAEVLASVVCNGRVGHEDWEACRRVGASLVAYDVTQESCWIAVELWEGDAASAAGYVTHLTRRLEEELRAPGRG